MNQMAFELRYLIADTGGLRRCDIDVLNTDSIARYGIAANTSARSNSSRNGSQPEPSWTVFDRAKTRDVAKVRCGQK